MGAEIAHVAAVCGMDVLLADADLARAEAGRARALDIGARRVERGRLGAADAAGAAGRITPVGGIGELVDVDVVIEAVPEDLDLKVRVHEQIDATVRPDILVATNTSGLSVTALADATRTPSRLIGLHFFNPASTMRLVEVIAGAATDDVAIARAVELAAQLGKTPVRVRECPGFVVNRILVRAMAEAYRAAAAAAVDRRAADRVVVEGGPAPMGPFALGDLVGLDVLESTPADLESAYGDRFADVDGACDDDSAVVSPGLDEVDDGVDNDCDGLLDEEGDRYLDASHYLIQSDQDGLQIRNSDLSMFASYPFQTLIGGSCGSSCFGEGTSTDDDLILGTYITSAWTFQGGIYAVDHAGTLQFALSGFSFPHDVVRDPVDGTLIVAEAFGDISWVAAPKPSRVPSRTDSG